MRLLHNKQTVKCAKFKAENTPYLYINDMELFLDPNYNGTPDLNVKLKSITSGLTLFEAEWTLPADYFADAPNSETDWTTFKSNYVADGTTSESLIIDLNQWALDNGYSVGNRHLFTVEVYLTDGTCTSATKIFNYTITLTSDVSEFNGAYSEAFA